MWFGLWTGLGMQCYTNTCTLKTSVYTLLVYMGIVEVGHGRKFTLVERSTNLICRVLFLS